MNTEDRGRLIARAEFAEATCQSLLDQSSRWEAQALEAEAHIRELETQIADAARIAESQEGEEGV